MYIYTHKVLKQMKAHDNTVNSDIFLRVLFSRNAIRENKILRKISELTVIGHQTPLDRCALRPLVKSAYLKN